MTSQEVHDLMEKAVESALTKFGIDTQNPIEVQRDLQFVRDWRDATDSVKGKAIAVTVVLIVTGALGAFWLGLRALLARS